MQKLLKCLILVSLIAGLTTIASQSNATTSPEAKTTTKSTVAKSPQKGLKAAPRVATATKAATIKDSVVPTPRKVPPSPKPIVYAVGCERYLPLINQYNWNTHVAAAIMQAESGCNPNAISNAYINPDGVPDYGLMQLHGLAILNPAENVAYAYYHKYLPAGGFTPWTTYTSGRYLTYLH